MSCNQALVLDDKPRVDRPFFAYPYTRASDIALANGTNITSPLNGYQYVKVQTVLPADDIDFEPWTNCAIWTNQTAEVYASPQFTARAEQAQDVLTTIHDSGLVGNRTVSLKNVYNVWDYVRSLCACDIAFSNLT